MLNRVLLIQSRIKKLNVNHESLCSFKILTADQQNDLSKGHDTPRNSDQIVLTGNKKFDRILDKGKVKVFEVMSIYEEAIGLKEIKQAQDNVLEAEKNFVTAQKLRRGLNSEILSIQSRLRALREEMDRLSRTDSRFLQLFTEEHEILKREQTLMNDYKFKEDEERDLFFFLSAALRDSQEKERARVERTKYLQLGLSIACTSLGIISAFLLSYFRSSSIREILAYEKSQFANTNDLMNSILVQQSQMQTILNENIATQNVALTESLNKSLQLMTKVNANLLVKEDEKPVDNTPTIQLQESLPNTYENNHETKVLSDIAILEPRKFLIFSSILLGIIQFYTRN